MKFSNLINHAFILAALAGVLLTGCSKDYENIEPMASEKQETDNFKSEATGTITSVTINGQYRDGLVCGGCNTATVKVNVLTIGTYNIYTVTSNGYSFFRSGIFSRKGLQDLEIPASGTPVATGINSFVFTFGNSVRSRVVVVSNTPVSQSSCSGNFQYYEVANHKTQKVWLDRNLGAARVAESATDHFAYGSLYQWGRLSDGHQCINWTSSTSGSAVNGTTSSTSNQDVPGHSNYIKTIKSPEDWRIPQNNNLWQGSSGTNNPCPSGYRLPTSIELSAEMNSWNTLNSAGAFGSALKFTVAGSRDSYDGSILDAGLQGNYWASTVYNTTKSNTLWFGSGSAVITDYLRAAGFSVRCIKN
jgi:uncharacterized protein (TIGR02145 family)